MDIPRLRRQPEQSLPQRRGRLAQIVLATAVDMLPNGPGPRATSPSCRRPSRPRRAAAAAPPRPAARSPSSRPAHLDFSRKGRGATRAAEVNPRAAVRRPATRRGRGHHRDQSGAESLRCSCGRSAPRDPMDPGWGGRRRVHQRSQTRSVRFLRPSHRPHMRGYVPQRQMWPCSASTMRASLGCGSCFRERGTTRIMPGVQ